MAGGRHAGIGGPLMRWLTQIFARRLVENNARLRARAEHYARKASSAEALAEARGRNEQRLAREIDARDERLIRQAAVITELRKRLEESEHPEADTVTALREELAKQKRVNDRLADQLLDATGHNGQPLTEAARETLGLPKASSR